MKIFAILIYVIPYFIFFLVYFFYTQKIYYYNKFSLVFISSVALMILMFFCGKKEQHYKTLATSSVLFFYILLLFLIRKTYKQLNTSFIKKHWVNSKHLNKDFTWVTISDFNYKNIWDEKYRPTHPGSIMLFPIVCFYYLCF